MKRKSRRSNKHPIEYKVYTYMENNLGSRSEPKYMIGRVKYKEGVAIQLIPPIPNLSNASHPRPGERFVQKKTKKK